MGHHHMSFKGRDHQVVWADLDAWIQQLWEEFGGQCEFAVDFPAAVHQVKPIITLTVEKRGIGSERKVLWCDYKVLDINSKCSTEALALQLVSAALLELSGDKERAERRAQLPLALL